MVVAQVGVQMTFQPGQALLWCLLSELCPSLRREVPHSRKRHTHTQKLSLSSVSNYTDHLCQGFLICGWTLERGRFPWTPRNYMLIYFSIHFYVRGILDFQQFLQRFSVLKMIKNHSLSFNFLICKWELKKKKALLASKGCPEDPFKQSVKAHCKSPLGKHLMLLISLPFFKKISLCEHFWLHSVIHKELKNFYLLFEGHVIACCSSKHWKEDWGTTFRK